MLQRIPVQQDSLGVVGLEWWGQYCCRHAFDSESWKNTVHQYITNVEVRSSERATFEGLDGLPNR